MKRLEDYLEVMSKCSHCAFCEAACPVFLEELLETHVARSRVGIIRAGLIDKKLSVTRRFKDVVNRCLLCTRCVASCPCGVPVDEVVIAARHEIYKGKRQNIAKRYVMDRMMERRAMDGWVKKAAAMGKKRGLTPEEIPGPCEQTFDDRYQGMLKPEGQPRARVAYYAGCATNSFFPETGADVVKVLLANGMEVVVPQGLSCCGIPALGEGDVAGAEKMMRSNMEILAALPVDAILTDCTSCGMALAEKSKTLIGADDPLHPKVSEVAAKVREVTEFLSDIGLSALPEGLDRRVTYHAPCHKGWGPGVAEAPEYLLSGIPGLEWVGMEDQDRCCGAGGTFFTEYPELSGKMRKKKVEAILRTGADTVVTQCPSCRMFLGAGLETGIEILHPVSLLAKGYDR